MTKLWVNVGVKRLNFITSTCAMVGLVLSSCGPRQEVSTLGYDPNRTTSGSSFVATASSETAFAFDEPVALTFSNTALGLTNDAPLALYSMASGEGSVNEEGMFFPGKEGISIIDVTVGEESTQLSIEVFSNLPADVKDNPDAWYDYLNQANPKELNELIGRLEEMNYESTLKLLNADLEAKHQTHFMEKLNSALQTEKFNSSEQSQLVVSALKLLPDAEGELDISKVDFTSLSRPSAYSGKGIGEKGKQVIDFGKANLKWSQISHLTNLDFMNLSNVDFTGANLKDKTFIGSIFSGSNVTAAQLFETAENLKGADLRGIDLSGVSMEKFSLYATKLENNNITMSDIMVSNEWGTANLAGYDVSGVDFSSSSLTQTKLSSLKNLTIAQIQSFASFSFTDYSDMDLTGLDLTGGNLNGSDFSNVKGLTMTDFQKADHKTSVNYSGIDLSKDDFTDAYLAGADLSNTGVSFAQLRKASDITSVKLGKMNVSNADLTGLDLRGVDFSQVIGLTVAKLLTAANFAGAKLPVGLDFSKVDLSGYDLRSVDFSRSIISAEQIFNSKIQHDLNFSHKDVSGLSFTGLDLGGFSFAFSNFKWSQTEGATSVQNMDLRGTDLRDADFAGVDLWNSDFSGARMPSNIKTMSDFTSITTQGECFYWIDAIQYFEDCVADPPSKGGGGK